MSELHESLLSMPYNKATGPDSVPAEFSKFWEQLNNLFL